MILHTHLRKHIIRPVCKDMGFYDLDVEELLVMVCGTESFGGKYLKQLGKGPAVGIYQMEPRTHDDIWAHFLKYKQHLADKILRWEIPKAFEGNNYKEMAGNLYYATAMARCYFLRNREVIPPAGHIETLAAYYKEYWNTYEGDATVQKAIEDYQNYIRV